MDDSAQRVLVVEDDEDNRVFITRTLENAGYAVFGAGTGEDGIAQFEEHKPDLLIVDVLLPSISGWEVLRKVKTEFRDRHVPVIMLTVKDSDRDKLGGYVMGADYYIGKPFSMGLLLQVVADLLKQAGEAVHE